MFFYTSHARNFVTTGIAAAARNGESSFGDAFGADGSRPSGCFLPRPSAKAPTSVSVVNRPMLCAATPPPSPIARQHPGDPTNPGWEADLRNRRRRPVSSPGRRPGADLERRVAGPTADGRPSRSAGSIESGSRHKVFVFRQQLFGRRPSNAASLIRPAPRLANQATILTSEHNRNILNVFIIG